MSLDSPWKVLEFCFSEVVLTMCSIIVLGVVRSLLNLWPTDDLRGNEVYECYSDLVELYAQTCGFQFLVFLLGYAQSQVQHD